MPGDGGQGSASKVRSHVLSFRAQKTHSKVRGQCQGSVVTCPRKESWIHASGQKSRVKVKDSAHLNRWATRCRRVL